MKKNHIYRVTFVNHSKVYEIFARKIDDQAMIGFIALSELIFGERSSLVVDPSEEKLKNEFQDVQCSYVPIHSIIRIDSVEKEGIAKIVGESSQNNVSPFPLYTPKPSKD